MHLLKGLSRVWVVVVGGGGVGGWKRVVIFFKNFISYILITNSQTFPLLLNMFINVFFTKKTL